VWRSACSEAAGPLAIKAPCGSDGWKPAILGRLRNDDSGAEA
jgi:hypothetical protein